MLDPLLDEGGRRLGDLFVGVPRTELRGDPGTRILDVAYGAGRPPPGTIYFCPPGVKARVVGAVEAGVAALVTERWLDFAVPQAKVPSVMLAMGPVAAEFFGHPSRDLLLAGITGTDGKTTVSFMLERAFMAAGFKTGLISSVERHIGDAAFPATLTTPHAPHVQRLLAEMRDGGADAAVLEVSSYGLLFGRVEGCRFACGVFTNLTPEHLDVHGTMEGYFAAKAALFDPERCDAAAVNTDDAFGRRLIERATIPTVTFGLEHDADVRGRIMESSRDGTRFEVRTASDVLPVQVNLPGVHNVSNALATIASCSAVGVSLSSAVEGIAALAGVPGRLEPVDAGQEFTVLVDFAHTPNGLEKALGTARAMVGRGGRLVCVFGCSGTRDSVKRALMGQMAADLADLSVITTDDPRSFDPMELIAEIEVGARIGDGEIEIVPDRRDAIRLAVVGANPGDVIIITGRGHYRHQLLAGGPVPFDDKEVAREALARRLGS